jgi:methionyl-tRNA formyltransferase
VEGVGERATRVLLVGDAPGVAQTLRVMPPSISVGIVAASNRPQYHDELERIAAELGLPLFVQPSPKSEAYRDFVDAVRAQRPDLIFCNSYSMVLQEDLLTVAPRGGVNVHGGRLPQFRGANPIQWAIIEGERETAVTMHEMTPELDAGAVIAERPVPIRFADSWRDVLQRIQLAAEELLATELPAVLAGTAPSRSQDERAARRRRRRTPEDSRIDWSGSVAQVYDFVRALGDGIPPAFYEHNGERVEVERLSLAEAAALVLDPGAGGRQFVRGNLQLVPAGGELVDLHALRDGRRTGLVRIEAVDLDARLARIWVDPPHADVAALAAEFARSELAFTVVG